MSGAPSFEILGSFFPAWMLCVVVALVLTALCRLWLLRTKREEHVGPLVLFYPSLIVLASSLAWLLLYGC